MSKLTDRIRAFAKRENETLDVETFEIRVPELSPGLSGFRIAILSDLHFRVPTAYHDRIVKATRDAKPGAILIAGDVIDEHTGGIDLLTGFFAQLCSIAPVIAVLGNNDCIVGRIETLRAMYRRAGVILLENETRLLGAHGRAIRITGLTDPDAIKFGIHKTPAKEGNAFVELPKALAPGQTQGHHVPSILIIHRPQLARKFISMHPTLIVSGHAHGGQIRVSGIGGLFAPEQGIFPKLTSGLYSIGDTRLVVSRGLGNHGFPLRLGNRPHIPVCVLLPENAAHL